jgi:hypothetical protein
VASQLQLHKYYGTLRPRGNAKKPKATEDMIAKSGLHDSDGSDDSSVEFYGNGGWTASDRTLRPYLSTVP